MSLITSMLGIDGAASAIAGLGNNITDVVKRFIPDPDKALEAKQEVERLMASRDTSMMQAMQAVMTADSQSDSKYVKFARPTLFYWCLGVVTVIMGASAVGHAQPIVDGLNAVPHDLWDMMKASVGIYIVGRSTEKVATTVTEAVKAYLAGKKK